jgi:hypothetical protein
MPSTHSRVGSDTQPSDPIVPTPIDKLARRKYLDRLLDTRAQLAVLSSERYSHRLPDASDTYMLQLGVESEIQNEFPDVYEEKFPNWVRQDAELDHPAGQLHPDCGICRTIAVSRGVNIDPPEAA